MILHQTAPTDRRIIAPARRAARACIMPGLVLLVGSLAACGPPGCGNPHVLDFVDELDQRNNLAHVDLVRDGVRETPTADPNHAQCSIWQRVRNPAYGTAPKQPFTVLQPQFYGVTQVSNGWRVDMPE